MILLNIKNRLFDENDGNTTNIVYKKKDELH
jgi:hypothetical protein